MSAFDHTLAAKPLISLSIAEEGDIVVARQRARQIAGLLGLSNQDQARLATAVSEIARNAFQYAKQGRVDFSIDMGSTPQKLWVLVSDKGPGIPNLEKILGGGYESRTGMGIGITGARRLMDQFHIRSEPGKGVTILFAKTLPETLKPLQIQDLATFASQLLQQRPASTFQELERQNVDLLHTLDLVRVRELELQRRQGELARLNLELEETNRGVVALYSELDEKAAALRRADEMKSRILSHVSHEFRTPVNSMLALTQILLLRVDGELSDEQVKQVGYIRQAAQELADMVNDLLDLAKVEAGRIDVKQERVELGPLFGSIRALMRPLATNEAVALVFEEPPAGVWLQSDEGKLNQILRNLISNALKFTEHGRVRVSVTPSGDRGVSFCVQDTGIGIAPENLDRIFQEFAQVENPMQRHVKGTGLGLPLSRKLAALLGGTLEVTSKPGSGSLFVLTLPESSVFTSGGEQADVRGTAHTILLIDDEETSRYISHQLLRGTSYRILDSASPSEGAERARFERPALILLDLVLPERSGFDVLDELKSDPATRDIPVIIQTSKKMAPADFDRLASRHVALLPKAGPGRLEALIRMREILSEPNLFQDEPEFKQEIRGER